MVKLRRKTCDGHRRQIQGSCANDYGAGNAIDKGVVNDELNNINTRNIRDKSRTCNRWITQCRLATGIRSRNDGPLIRERIKIGIGRETAVKLDDIAFIYTLIKTRKGNRGGIDIRNSHRAGRTVDFAIVDNELRDIVARHIQPEIGADRGQTAQRRITTGRPCNQRPQIRQRIAVRIERACTVQDGGAAMQARLRRTSECDRRTIGG